MLTYFFVPATKLSKISNILSYRVDEIVIDLEDGVASTDLCHVLYELMLTDKYICHFVRVPVVVGGEIDLNIILKLYEAGFRKFMLPKIRSYNNFRNIFEQVSFLPNSIILLIESPSLLFDMAHIIRDFSEYLYGICLGSHDYISETGGVYCLANLEYPRQLILNYARIADILAIDIASMEIDAIDVFESETIDGFKKGYDAKLLIHPTQLAHFNELQFYSKEEFVWAKKVKDVFDKRGSNENFSPIIIEGKVVERPHLRRAKAILKWFDIRNSK